MNMHFLHNFLKGKFNPFSHTQSKAVTRAVLRNRRTTSPTESATASHSPREKRTLYVKGNDCLILFLKHDYI